MPVQQILPPVMVHIIAVHLPNLSTCSANLNNILIAMNAQFFFNPQLQLLSTIKHQHPFSFWGRWWSFTANGILFIPNTHYQASTTILLKWVFKDFVYWSGFSKILSLLRHNQRFCWHGFSKMVPNWFCWFWCSLSFLRECYFKSLLTVKLTDN